MDLLWPECEATAGRNSLRQALASPRRQLEPPGVPAGAVIVAHRTTVALRAESITTDVAELEAALASAARERDPALAARERERAVLEVAVGEHTLYAEVPFVSAGDHQLTGETGDGKSNGQVFGVRKP